MTKLYMNCPFQEKTGNFETNQNISEEEYVRMLREYSSTIGKGNITNNTDRRYNIVDVRQQKVIEENNLSSADVEVYSMSGKKCTSDDISVIEKKGMAVLILELLDDSMEEAFQDEFKFWKQDSMKIITDSQLEEDDKIRFLPMKELQLEMDYHLWKLTNCKLYHDYNDGKYAIIVQKITKI